MAINIQSLFSDIIETPAQRQERMLTEGILRGRELTSGLTGLARTQAPLVAALSMQMPQRQDALRTSVGGLLGLDVRTDSERVQEALSGVDPYNPESILQAAQMIGDMGLGAQAAQMRQMAADVVRQRQADEMARQQFAINRATSIQELQSNLAAQEAARASQEAQMRFRNRVADLAQDDERFAPIADSIRDGSAPEETVNNVVESLTEKVDPKKLTLLQGIVDGNQVTLNTDGFGNYFKLDGTPVLLEEDDTVIPASASGSFADASGLSEKQRDTLSEMQRSTYNFISSANNVIRLLEDNPNINTFAAQGAGIIDDLVQEARAVASAINPEVSTDIDDYKDVFDDIGTMNARFKSATFGLALQYAAASGLGSGRELSENDVKQAIRAIGVNRTNPNAIISVLQDRKQSIEDQFRGAYRIFNDGQEFQGSLDKSSADISDLLN